MSGQDTQFWADQIAQEIISRKRFHYSNEPVTQPDEYVVKTSASLSGVLHIGRLSDTIRGESVAKALLDAGKSVRFIWVAEDMDPLRKVPKGVPKGYEQYLGMPVTDVPDPEGSYDSYAARHVAEYFEVIDQFVTLKLAKFSMREEYRKGTFRPYIQKILEQFDRVKDIQNSYRTNPLPEGWSPWKPICEKCGRIATAHITGFDGKLITYECRDYHFENTIAKGCGHKGTADPLTADGKLMWKSEWASQWAAFSVVTEGAGKEYQVPNSAFWVNGEIVEKVLHYPMPLPIFYEHIMIDNAKMSASAGNVVYPRDWLKVAGPEHLRLLYNKRLARSRSFSWKDLPRMYDEYDDCLRIYNEERQAESEKEAGHVRRLFELSAMDVKEPANPVPFSHAALIAQVFPKEEDAIASLRKTGHFDDSLKDAIFSRLHKARAWVEKYGGDDARYAVQDTVQQGINLSQQQKEVLHRVADLLLSMEFSDDVALHEAMYHLAKDAGVLPKDFFRAAYLVLLNKERGPRLASFILALGSERVAKLFSAV
ncbi:TPA: lysine--tRNA ligase [Candidatus Woesearchaeota archaeon]|nr:lysine--tRNA ligase [Candidatus Woesearchaeota archaeon]